MDAGLRRGRKNKKMCVYFIYLNLESLNYILILKYVFMIDYIKKKGLKCSWLQYSVKKGKHYGKLYRIQFE